MKQILQSPFSHFRRIRGRIISILKNNQQFLENSPFKMFTAYQIISSNSCILTCSLTIFQGLDQIQNHQMLRHASDRWILRPSPKRSEKSRAIRSRSDANNVEIEKLFIIKGNFREQPRPAHVELLQRPEYSLVPDVTKFLYKTLNIFKSIIKFALVIKKIFTIGVFFLRK